MINHAIRDTAALVAQDAEELDHQPSSIISADEHEHGVPLHPDARRLFDCCPLLRRIPIFGEACEAYGPKCTISLGLCYILCKGVSDQIFSYARYPMFRERYGIDAERYQRLANISTMGWSIKAFTAVLCDTFAFLGYTKRWYMFASCVAGAAFAVAYGLLPAQPSSANIAAVFVFLSSYGKANVDILSEAYYSRLIRRIPKAGPALVSWIWWFITTGSIVASVIQGPLSDHGLAQVGVFISAGLQLVTCLIFLVNLYGEKRNREDRVEDAQIMHQELLKAISDRRDKRLGGEDDADVDAVRKKAVQSEPGAWNDPLALSDDLGVGSTQPGQRVSKGHAGVHRDEEGPELVLPEPTPLCCGLFELNKEVIQRNWRIAVYSVVMTCAVISMTAANILADTLGLLIACLVVSVVCCTTAFWALPPVIAKVNVFGYLQMVLYLQLPGALDSFFLATPDCLPDAPHFSYTFYNTLTAFIGNVAGIVGITAFRYIFSKRSYRLTLTVTTLLQIVSSVFDIIIVQRWNTKIGIPDHVMYIGGDAIIGEVCYMLSWMPMVILLSRMCPRGSESMVFALLAGFDNFGQSTSSSIGAILMEYVWPVVSEPPCDFSNVTKLVIAGHICLPLLIIPLTLLLPVARVCDDIDVDGRVIRKEAEKELRGKRSSGNDKYEAPVSGR